MISLCRHIIRDAAAVLGSWPAFGALILLSLLVFGYLVPRAKAPIFAGMTAKLPRKVLDEYVPTWTPQIAQAFLAAVGPDGRAAYRRFYWTMDFWFPGAAASMALASLLLIAFTPASGWGWLALLAAPSWLFDAMENITHFRMAGSYPVLSSTALRFGPLFTGAKWLFAILPLPLAAVGLIAKTFHWLH